MQYQIFVQTLTNRVIYSLLIILIVSLAQPVFADSIDDLYETQVWVDSQDKKERADKLKQAFIEILIRVTGKTDINSANYPGIKSAVDVATRYAQQFRYLKYTPQPGSTAQGNLILWVRFDEAAISSLLRSNNIAVWGKTRPATLVWLVIDNKGQRDLIGNDSAHDARTVLLQQAKQRGVPLRLPLLDLTDRGALRTSDVWGNFESTILKASERYQTEAVLVGRVYEGYAGTWNARWSLYADSRRQDNTVTGSSIDEVLRPGVNSTAEILASRYALVGPSDMAEVLVQVNDVKNLKDYNRVVKYLDKLSNISAIHPFELHANTVIFRLTTASGRLGVARAVALGHILVNEPVQDITIPKLPGTDAGTNTAVAQNIVPDLVYRLIP